MSRRMGAVLRQTDSSFMAETLVASEANHQCRPHSLKSLKGAGVIAAYYEARVAYLRGLCPSDHSFFAEFPRFPCVPQCHLSNCAPMIIHHLHRFPLDGEPL